MIENADTCSIWLTSRQYSSTQTSDGATQSEENYEESIRIKILEASLPFVKDLGWSKEALVEGTKAAGYPGVTHGMFLKGGADLVHYFQSTSNQKLVEYLKQDTGATTTASEFVEDAVRYRLLMIVPYVAKWPQAIAIMTLPPNVPNALASLLTMVDDICYYAGDRSVDFDWYARRIALAGVYKATELYMLQDSSPEYVETGKFLNRRLSEAILIHNLLLKSDYSTQTAKDGVSSAFTTARNILGMNWNR